MSNEEVAAKYGELHSLVKNYRDKKREESKLLRRQLENEISTNIELRKTMALLEAKLINEKDRVAELERLYRDAMSHVDEDARKRDNGLREMASDLASRLRKVEEREQECTVRATAIGLREEQFWEMCSNFEKKRAEFEQGLSACKKAMDTELQHGRKAINVAKDCLFDIRVKADDLTDREQELEDKALHFQHQVHLVQEERLLRDRVIGHEFELRCALFGSFFNGLNSHLEALLSQNAQEESLLRTRTDLLSLHEVEFSTRVRKERDLCREDWSKSELLRREFALECQNVLHEVTDLLDSIADVDVNALRVQVEAKLQAMLQQPLRGLN